MAQQLPSDYPTAAMKVQMPENSVRPHMLSVEASGYLMAHAKAKEEHYIKTILDAMGDQGPLFQLADRLL